MARYADEVTNHASPQSVRRIHQKNGEHIKLQTIVLAGTVTTRCYCGILRLLGPWATLSAESSGTQRYAGFDKRERKIIPLKSS